MRRRGFTLIELAVVVVLLGLISTPFLAMTASMYREFKTLAMTTALKTECDRVGYLVLRVAAEGSGPWHLESDNHGVLFSGRSVHWKPGVLTVTEAGRTRHMAIPAVVDCCMVRRGQALVVTVSVSGPQRPGGQPVESHGTYVSP